MILYDLPDSEARIPLIGGAVAIVDSSDEELVAGYPWRVLEGHNGKRYAYAKTNDGGLYMHRIIAGTPIGMETDHINGDGLDNRRANLRVATPSQNSANTRKANPPAGKTHSSGYKGVHWERGREKWRAQIVVNRRARTIGRFDDEREAAMAYDLAAVATWGDFAFTNFPRKEPA